MKDKDMELLLSTEEGRKFTEQISKMGRKYNHSISVSNTKSSDDIEVFKDVLTEKEKDFVGRLRYPKHFVARKHVDDAIPEMEQDEIRTLFDKMDEYIEIEGKIRRAMGSFDEMYVLELSNVKDRLKNMLKDMGKE